MQNRKKRRREIGKERLEEREREFVCETLPVDVRAEVAVLVPCFHSDPNVLSVQ